MQPHLFDSPPASPARRLGVASLVAIAAVLAALLLISGSASASIAERQEALADVQTQQASIEEELAASNDEINSLIARVSEAREREAAVATELAETEARLDQAVTELEVGREHLERVRVELRAAVGELEEILVGVYKSDDPDMINLLIEAANWDDDSVDAAYLDRIHAYQVDTIERVKGLRAEAEATVTRLSEARQAIAENRDEIAARRQALADERAALEAEEAELAAARQARRATLSRLAGRAGELENGIESAQQRNARERRASIPPPAPEPATPEDVAAPPVSAPAPSGSTATLNADGSATAPADAPPQVVAVIEAANEIRDKPYLWGGGHAGFEIDSGYDCSGAISYALNAAGLIETPLDSTGFTYWGEAGVGNWITVYGNSGHAYAVIAGLRWDTSGTGGSGVSWSTTTTSFQPASAFVARHPAGL